MASNWCHFLMILYLFPTGQCPSSEFCACLEILQSFFQKFCHCITSGISHLQILELKQWKVLNLSLYKQRYINYNGLQLFSQLGHPTTINFSDKGVWILFQTENSSYFIAARHKLSAFFSLVFRFSSCHHPLLASALAKIMEDQSNHIAISKEENAVRQLISMISSDNRHVVHTTYPNYLSVVSHVQTLNMSLFF